MPRTAWAGLALAIAVACSGDTATTVDDETVEDATEVAQNRIAGTWKVELVEKRQRRFAIIAAALSAEPLRMSGVGKLDKAERDLFDTWQRKRGRDVREMEKKLRLTKARFVIGDGRITVRVDNDGIPESYGPVDYEILEGSDRRTVLRFDPGMGNGYETHTLLWTGPDAATDRITANGRALIELPWKRVSAPATPPTAD